MDRTTSLSPGRAAVVVGAGLLIMIVFSIPAALWLDAATRDPGGPAADRAAGAFLVVALLDLVVAWGLTAYLAPAHRDLATLAGLLRAAYAVALLAAVPALATGGAAGPAAFTHAWDVALAVFGVHLVVVGVLVHRSGWMPRWLGWLVVVAGAGYAVDGAAAALDLGLGFEFGTVTFVGEVVLMIWLLWRGRRVPEGPQPVGAVTTTGRSG